MNRKKKGLISNIFIIIFVAGIIFSVVYYGYQNYLEKRAEDSFVNLRNETTEVTRTEETKGLQQAATGIPQETELVSEQPHDKLKELGIQIPEKRLDFQALQQKNADIYAWIYVPDTNIDYPILQHADDDQYYLQHNLDGSNGLPGCIFTESLNNKNFLDRNTILYGHNMKNKTMFGTLHKFDDTQFFNSHSYFYIYTPEKTFVYQIFAAYAYEDVHLLHDFDLQSQDGFEKYLQMVFENSDKTANLRREVEVDSTKHIVTLSTCDYRKENMRYLVQGVLLND